MTADHPYLKPFPSGHYYHLWKQAEPPRQVYIDMYKYDGGEVATVFRQSLNIVPIKQNPGVNGVVYVFTLVVGNRYGEVGEQCWHRPEPSYPPPPRLHSHSDPLAHRIPI